LESSLTTTDLDALSVLAIRGGEVLPPAVKARVAVEQASTPGWDGYVGDGETAGADGRDST
jgi:hypothetical protein